MKKKREISINLNKIAWIVAILIVAIMAVLTMLEVVEPMEVHEAQGMIWMILAFVMGLVAIESKRMNEKEDEEKED